MTARSPIKRLLRAWRRVRPLMGERTRPVFLLTASSVGAGLAEAGVLTLIAQVAAALVVDGDQMDAAIGPLSLQLSIGASLAAAFVLAAVRAGLQAIVAWLPARISADVQARLRRDLFASYSRATWAVQSGDREGHLQELMGNQIAHASQAVTAVATVLSSGAMFIALTASAFVLSVPVAIVVLVSAVALVTLLRPLNRLGRSAAAQTSQANMDTAAGVSEAVRLSEEAHVFGTGDAQRADVDGLIEAARVAFFRFQLAGRLAQSTYQSLAILLIVAGLAGLHAAGAGNLASLGAAVLMLVRAGSYGQMLQSGYHHANQMLPYLDRLDAAAQRYLDSAEPDGTRSLDTIESLRFVDASFGYGEDRPVLSDLSFEITAGDTIGVVGPSGAGKSTLVQLLLRLRLPDSGAFLLNGTPAEEFRKADWQRRIAYVPQEPRVIHGTIADNIRYFRDVSSADVERAARLAHIDTEIMAMSAGYDTVIGPRADALSGGQRQRICLARALAGRPDLIVLDEPTSALDLNSEAAVQASLADLHGDITLVIVAHRVSTLSICDRVLVLAAGRVEAFAPASELKATNAFFQRAISLSQTPG